MKAILCGGMSNTPAAILRMLSAMATEIYVYTHPDGAFGEGLTNPCQEMGIDSTTASINKSAPPFRPDIIISVYYKHIIGQPIIDLVEGQIINAHTSLLPRHRGRSAIPWALIEGDTYTGATWHYIDKGIDTGPIILQMSVPIEDYDTQYSLYKKVGNVIIGTFPAVISLVQSGYAGHPQSGPSNYNSQSPPHGGEISPHWPSAKIERFIRAMIYPGLPPAKFQNKPIKSFEDYRQALFERWQNERDVEHTH